METKQITITENQKEILNYLNEVYYLITDGDQNELSLTKIIKRYNIKYMLHLNSRLIKDGILKKDHTGSYNKIVYCWTSIKPNIHMARKLEIKAKEHSINTINKRKNKPNSKYKGVHFDIRKNKWRCQKVINKKQRHIGYYDTEIEAKNASDNVLVKNNSIDKDEFVSELIKRYADLELKYKVREEEIDKHTSLVDSLNVEYNKEFDKLKKQIVRLKNKESENKSEVSFFWGMIKLKNN